jgi:hypothetical protein
MCHNALPSHYMMHCKMISMRTSRVNRDRGQSMPPTASDNLLGTTSKAVGSYKHHG